MISPSSQLIDFRMEDGSTIPVWLTPGGGLRVSGSTLERKCNTCPEDSEQWWPADSWDFWRPRKLSLIHI